MKEREGGERRREKEREGEGEHEKERGKAAEETRGDRETEEKGRDETTA